VTALPQGQLAQPGSATQPAAGDTTAAANLARAANARSDFNIGYCGYRFNGDIGAYTVRFRHYDPTPGMCRWLERDPAGYQDGPSLYSYLGRNPMAGTDPYGLASCDDAESKTVGHSNPNDRLYWRLDIETDGKGGASQHIQYSERGDPTKTIKARWNPQTNEYIIDSVDANAPSELRGKPIPKSLMKRIRNSAEWKEAIKRGVHFARQKRITRVALGGGRVVSIRLGGFAASLAVGLLMALVTNQVVAAYIEDHPQYARLQAYIRDGNADAALGRVHEIARDLETNGWNEEADAFERQFIESWDDFFPGVPRPRGR
jgi:RHS repeat-associated protein